MKSSHILIILLLLGFATVMIYGNVNKDTSDKGVNPLDLLVLVLVIFVAPIALCFAAIKVGDDMFP